MDHLRRDLLSNIDVYNDINGGDDYLCCNEDDD